MVEKLKGLMFEEEVTAGLLPIAVGAKRSG
jgi:hypothetical protein